MFGIIGETLSTAVKVATIPLNIASASVDLMAGGDGSKSSRTDGMNPFGNLEELRDELADFLEEDL